MFIPWVLCGALFVILIFLSGKLRLLKKAFDEIRDGLNECLSQDTNALATISTGDRHARRLAAELNENLRLLREQRLRYQTGDRELKEAITNISHDLRTPITAIRGYLDLLNSEEMSEDVRRYLSIVENRIDALKILLDELFQYSVCVGGMGENFESGYDEFSDVCLNNVLEESVAEYYAALTAKGITPVINMPDAKVIRRIGKNAISRVLGNIINNALKYSDGDLEIILFESGEMRFTNTASGLTEVQVGKLFNRFYTVNSARNGAGLGLSITQMLVDRMNGQMSARYADDKLSIIVSFSDE
jgi:signal transduction histidine kinase